MLLDASGSVPVHSVAEFNSYSVNGRCAALKKPHLFAQWAVSNTEPSTLSGRQLILHPHWHCLEARESPKYWGPAFHVFGY